MVALAAGEVARHLWTTKGQPVCSQTLQPPLPLSLCCRFHVSSSDLLAVIMEIAKKKKSQPTTVCESALVQGVSKGCFIDSVTVQENGQAELNLRARKTPVLPTAPTRAGVWIRARGAVTAQGEVYT